MPKSEGIVERRLDNGSKEDMKAKTAEDRQKPRAQLVEELREARRLVAELKREQEEQNRVVEALRESEERFRSLVEDSPDFIYIADAQGKVLFINKTLPQHMRDEVIGRTIYDFALAEYHDIIRKTVALVFETGNTAQYGSRASGPGNSISYYETRCSPIIRNGAVEAFIGVSTDTTAQKRAEDNLRKSEAFQRSLLETSPDFIFILDANEAILSVNRVHPAHHKEDVLGKDISYFLAPDHCDAFRRSFRLALDTGQLQTVEAEVVLPDGNHFMFCRLNPVSFDDAGSVVLIATDITDRKKFEEQLRAERDRAQSYVDLADIVFVQLDRKARITMINRAGAELLGIAREDAPGEPWIDRFIPERMRAEVTEVFGQVMSGVIAPSVARFENPVVTASGDERTILWNNVTLRDDAGRPVGTLSAGQDITEQEKDRAERRKFQEHVQETQRMESLATLAGGIAHDFNNLLMGVLGNANLALADISPLSPIREKLECIELAAKRASDLAKQMLAYSGRGAFVITQLDCNDLIEEMEQLLRTSTPEKSVLRLALSSKLPLVAADATQMRQVIMNLLLNAAEAIGTRGGVITIATGTSAYPEEHVDEDASLAKLSPGLYVYVEVSDTGCGMDTAIQDRIFEPFFTTKFSGRGLGLAAVQGIVHGHGGALQVHSEVGRGTIIKILLPATEGATVDLEAVSDHVPKRRKWEGFVLLVDDEQTVLAVAKRMLEHIGFDVILASDGKDAIAKYVQHRDDIVLVILDLTMPRMNGGEAMRELQRIDPTVRVVLSSGYSEQEISQRFKDHGVKGFIQKPYTVRDLTEKLQRIFGTDETGSTTPVSSRGN